MFMRFRNILEVAKVYEGVTRNRTSMSAEYCLESVRRHDYENFICTLLLQKTSRSNALAIRSFNIEVAKVAEQVSQSNIGLMRMKFWEEVIDKCFHKDIKEVPQHPVAIELHKAINNKQLTKRYLKTLVMSRIEHMNKNTFLNLEEIESYSEKTVSNVYYLLLEGSGVKNIHADHVASHLGKAQGITQQLRSIPLAKQLNLISIPEDILTKNKVSQEEIIRSKQSVRLTECSFEVACRAYQHLSKALNLLTKVPTEARDVFLPAIAVENYLERLQKVQYDVFHSSLQQRAWILLPKLWFRHIKNKY